MRQLLEWIGGEVRYFAYPYGRENGQLRRAVQSVGYEAACGRKAGGVGREAIYFCFGGCRGALVGGEVRALFG
jgi:peptidoglycan/xylan/chitin deacetylase (PgdA/CDA1 family)